MQGLTKIEDLRHVERGDHVAWHRDYVIWHHAIVVDVPDGGRALTVIHNIKVNSSATTPDRGHDVCRQTIDVDPTNEDFYRVDYPAADTYPVEAVIQRAHECLGQAYHLLKNNCEHFATWCKTGLAKSGQVRTVLGRVILVCISAVSKFIPRAAYYKFKWLMAESLCAAGQVDLSGIGRLLAQVAGAVPGVVRYVKWGAFGCNVAVTMGLEVAMFIKEVVKAYRKYRSGAISRDEFRRQLCKLGCECGLGVISIVAGIVLQLFIPVPFVGLLGTLGFECGLGVIFSILSACMRFFGAIIGKLFAKKL